MDDLATLGCWKRPRLRHQIHHAPALEARCGERQLSFLIVRPIAYRLRKGAHLSYRNPAYLISSDPALAPQQILQAYLWRWEALCGPAT